MLQGLGCRQQIPVIQSLRGAMTGYLFVAIAVLVAVAGMRVRHRLGHQTAASAFRMGWSL